jgi:hypothetical protein
MGPAAGTARLPKISGFTPVEEFPPGFFFDKNEKYHVLRRLKRGKNATVPASIF